MMVIVSLFIILTLHEAASVPSIPSPDEQFHIFAMPFGEETATVLQCPKDEHNDKGLVTLIVEDTSNFDNGIETAELIKFLNGTRLNFTVLNHPHSSSQYSYIDHLLDAFQTRVNVFHPCCWVRYHVKSMYAMPLQVPKCNGIKDCESVAPRVPALCPNSPARLSFVASSVLGECDVPPSDRDTLMTKIVNLPASVLFVPGRYSSRLLDRLSDKSDIKASILQMPISGGYDASILDFLKAVGASFVYSGSLATDSPRCEIYDYYKKILKDNIVPMHLYTCFNKAGVFVSTRISKAIYSTSVVARKDDSGNLVRVYHIIKISINSNGHITAKVIHYCGKLLN